MPFVFPARSPSRMRQIAQLFRVLEILLESLRSGVVVTKRDIYYRDSALFSTQGVVDRLVEQLAVSMRVERHQLGVVASPRDLFSGNVVVSYLTAAGRRRDVAAAGTAKLVPSEGVEQYDVETGAPWMLIIEKEASFRRICDDQRGPASPLRDGIIVTAKGYPDYATSAFVAVVARRYPW
ncbi:uncharacterized protein PFL1_06021 [Pseudozyma flocculosa PF-1]|nr:uncharacterized protein PFL1_06021 [Pseudozyma flocculosa PF-1]EPQ26373.1 hypothetical protein PFL1_06021 [Pseudozyma flocculosa PF-1]